MDLANSINVGGVQWDKDENGAWIYKAEKSNFTKKDGTLKKKYADMPRYSLIPKMEQHFVDQFNSSMSDTAKDVISSLKKMIE